MFIQPTIDKLHALKLTGMADAVREQLEDPGASQLSFEERLGLIVDHHWSWKENQALQRRLMNSKLRRDACIEDIDWQHVRGLDRGLVRSLATSDWVRQHHQLLLTGPTGVGKSFLASAFAQRALPGWIHGFLHTGGATIPQLGGGASRWQLWLAVAPARTSRRAGRR